MKSMTANLAEVVYEPVYDPGYQGEDETMQECPVELLRLQEICSGDKEFERELIDVFLSDSMERIQTMESALADKNLEIFKLQAHSIKGMSANAGADNLTRIAATMEQENGDWLSPETARMMEELKTEYEKVRAFLTRYLDEELPPL